MTTLPVASEARLAAESGRQTRRHNTRLWTIWLAVAVVAFLAAGVYFANAHWPYRYRIVKPMLESVLGSQLQISRYHRTYFPHPGFVATGLTLRRKSAPDLPPLGSAEQMVVEGRWIDLLLLRKRVQLVDITALHIVVPAVGSRANQEDFPPGSASDFAGPDALIEELKIHNGLLEVMRSNGSRFSFPVMELDLRNFQKGRANTYWVDMQNAKPWGRIQSTGRFGPLNARDLGTTAVSGTYSFSSVKVRDVGNIRGTLSSSGQFSGSLAAMEVTGDSLTPDFAVGNGKPTRVTGGIRCKVDGLTGEVIIHEVSVTSGTTTAVVSGAIIGSPKVTNLEIVVNNGRAQDVLRPFIRSDVPITGPLWLQSHAYVGPAREGVGFLQRLVVNGAFAVPAELATDRATEKSLTEFSQRAQSNKAGSQMIDRSPNTSADVLSSLKGAAQIRDGIVSSTGLTFQIAGAKANLSGTFNLRDLSVHLTGNFAMQSDISHAVTGFKSVLLRPLDPFLKKRNAGAVIPVAVTGGPGHYKVTQDFSHTK